MTKSFIKADKLAAVVRGLASLVKEQVLVGVPDSTTERGDDDEAGPMNNATLGYIHEHGSPAANIPARPHLIPGIENAQNKIADRFKKAGQFAMDGKKDKVHAELEKAGLVAQNSVKSMITDGDLEPLAESTLRARARRGRKGAIAELESRAAGNAPDNSNARPLLDTGQYRNSITFVVRNK